MHPPNWTKQADCQFELLHLIFKRYPILELKWSGLRRFPAARFPFLSGHYNFDKEYEYPINQGFRINYIELKIESNLGGEGYESKVF